MLAKQVPTIYLVARLPVRSSGFCDTSAAGTYCTCISLQQTGFTISYSHL